MKTSDLKNAESGEVEFLKALLLYLDPLVSIEAREKICERIAKIKTSKRKGGLRAGLHPKVCKNCNTTGSTALRYCHKCGKEK